MATFIPGVQGVIPEALTQTIDFDRVDKLLKLREGLYAKGAKKVQNLYQTAFNSPLLRDDNVKRRDEYLKAIDQGLQTVSSSDLSLVENQQYADSLFEPITSDKDLVKDLVFTKQYYSEKSRASDLLNSTDPEKRKMYWGEGIAALDYQAEEFKNADSKTAASMSAPKYVPQVDILSYANKAYKEAGISVKQDVIKGGYIWTMKNGQAVLPITQSFVSTLFTQDPAIKQMLATRAYVERKNYIKQNAPRFGGSEELAEKEYLKTQIQDVFLKNVQASAADDKEVSRLRTEVESWEKVNSTTGILYGSDDFKKYEEAKAKLELAEQAASIRKNELIIQQINDLNDIDQVRTAVQSAVVMYNAMELSNQIASHLAYKDAQVTVKADPYKLSEFKGVISSKLEGQKQQNRIIMQAIKAADAIKAEENKQENRQETAKTKHEYTKEEIKERAKNSKKGGKGSGQLPPNLNPNSLFKDLFLKPNSATGTTTDTTTQAPASDTTPDDDTSPSVNPAEKT